MTRFSRAAANDDLAPCDLVIVTEWVEYEELLAMAVVEPGEATDEEDVHEEAGVIVTDEVDEVLLVVLLLLLSWAANSSAEGLNGNLKLLLDSLMKFGRFVWSSSLDDDDNGDEVEDDEYNSGGRL